MAGTTDPTILKPAPTLKAGWKTTEFWVAVATIGAGIAGMLPISMPGWALAAIAAAYQISRGLAKQAQPLE